LAELNEPGILLVTQEVKMRQFGLKLCLFLFLAACFSGRTNELGVLTGALTGTILFWPLYRKLAPVPAAKPRRRTVVVEEDSEDEVALMK
jgi:hypothetical protein